MMKTNGWIGTLATAAVLLVVTSTTADAQQRGMMHGDTTSAAMRCPGGMGGMDMMHDRDMMGHGTMHGRQGMMGMRRGMGPATMGLMGPGPAMLLSQRDVLELTGDQVARLEELREKKQSMMKGMHEGMSAVRSRMQDVTAADDLDLEAYRSALESMADQMVGHHMQMARFRGQVLDVLTSEQRAKLQTGMKMMRHMMGGRGMGG